MNRLSFLKHIAASLVFGRMALRIGAERSNPRIEQRLVRLLAAKHVNDLLGSRPFMAGNA